MGLAPLVLGQVLTARYALERELGRGGIATVYLARDLQASRLVALKLLRPEVAAALGTERFLREIGLTAQLQHAHILGLLDSGEVEGCLYYTLPYVAGESLRARLQREPQLPVDEALRIAIEVAHALAYAHAQGVVHRDIKPETILLESTEAGARVRVTDVGIAQALHLAGGERLTATGVAIGTPAYLSPEQASGEAVDGRSDLYSLGCVLYEMLGGEPPYTGPTGQAILAKQAKAPVPHLRALRPELPSAVEHAVTRALAKAPADRFATAEALAAALAPGQPAATVRLPRWRSRRMTAVVLGMVLLAAAGAGSAVLRSHGAPAAPAPLRPATDARRVAVAVFANQTGDPSLEALGDIVADYLTRGLAETGLVEVLDARADLPRDSARAAGAAGARALAHALGAGSVLWGTYARQGDSLRFEARLTDAATGNPMGPTMPATGPASQQTQGVEALRQRVMNTFAAQMDPRFAQYQAAGTSQPTRYEAYRELLTGDEIQPMSCPEPDVCMAKKAEHYRRSYELDHNFTLPLVLAAQVSAFVVSLGACARTDSIGDLLRPQHDRLPPSERYGLDWALALCHGQRADAFEAARQAMLAAPRSDRLTLFYADFARHNGHLREAIAVVEKLDRARNERNAGYWGNQVLAYHLLGEHRAELELAREARRFLPVDMQAPMWEACALAALGRLAEMSAVVDQMARMPQVDLVSQVSSLTWYMDLIGRDLRAHGYPKEAQALFERAIRWHEARPAAEQHDFRDVLARVLYDAGRWVEAQQILRQLAAETPNELELRAMLGAVAARLGDLPEVARVDRWLAAQKRPYLNGEHTYHRARLAAILGDRDRAVALYRQAVVQGFGFRELYGVHTDPDFESVRGYPPFEALPGRF